MSKEQQPQQQQQSGGGVLQYRQVGTVWEGEWPAVKETVRTVRKATWFVYGFLHDALYFPGATKAVSNSLHRVDEGVHAGSIYVAQYMNRASPWLGSASAVVFGSVVTTVKSNHYWGPVAAARNGLIFLTASSLFFYPAEIRDAVFGPATPNSSSSVAEAEGK